MVQPVRGVDFGSADPGPVAAVLAPPSPEPPLDPVLIAVVPVVEVEVSDAVVSDPLSAPPVSVVATS